jgi:hypothetical protein
MKHTVFVAACRQIFKRMPWKAWLSAAKAAVDLN